MGWRRHKKVIDAVKGFRGRAKNCYTIAVNRYEKGLQHAYRHRRTKRREARRTWITQVRPPGPHVSRSTPCGAICQRVFTLWACGEADVVPPCCTGGGVRLRADR